MSFSAFRFTMDYGFSRAVNMIKQRNAPFPETITVKGICPPVKRDHMPGGCVRADLLL
jgi:hypothetical protein